MTVLDSTNLDRLSVHELKQFVTDVEQLLLRLAECVIDRIADNKETR